MDYLKKNKISLILLYINMMFILTVFAYCYKISDFNYLILTLTFIISLLMYLFFQCTLKNKVQRFIIFIVFMLALAMIILLKNDLFIVNIEKIGENLTLANDLMFKGQMIEFILLKEVFVLSVFIILTILFILCDKGVNNLILLINFVCMTFLWYTGYSEEIKTRLFWFIFISAATYCCNSYLKVLRKDKKSGLKISVKKAEIGFTIFIGCFIIAILETLLPQQINGKLSSSTKTIFENKFIKSEASEADFGEEFKYNLSDSGYEDSENKLGGPVNIDNETVFKVKSDKPYYLRGATKDKYNGFSWKKSSSDIQAKSSSTKIYEDIQFSNRFINKSIVTIYPEKIKTTSLLTPNYAYDVTLDKGKVFYNKEDKTFIKGNSKPEKYMVGFYEIDKGMDIFDKNNAKEYKTLENYQQYDVIEKYKAYLETPTNLPPEVYELVGKITAGSKNSAEKVLKIKNYLNEKYKYSLDVSVVPEGKEFVSYFLFTEKKGYCTYFATAATVMCRIAEVPARYVEGFHMENIQDNAGLYKVTNEDAHAWSEVMLMPDEWLWTILDCVPNAPQLMHQGSEDINPTSGENTNTAKQERNKNNKEKPNKDVNGPKTSKIQNKSSNNIKLLFLIPISIIILYIITMFIIFFIRKMRILNSKSVLPLYCYCVKRLGKIGIIIPMDISDEEYFVNYNDTVLKENMKEIVDLCYREYYGNKKIEEFNKKGHYKFIEEYIRRKDNILKYVIKKYFYKY